MYEPMGWKIAGISNDEPQIEDLPVEQEISAENANEPAEDASEDVEYEEEYETEVEIPISEMKLADLKAYAAEHDIDISAAQAQIHTQRIGNAYVF